TTILLDPGTKTARKVSTAVAMPAVIGAMGGGGGGARGGGGGFGGAVASRPAATSSEGGRGGPMPQATGVDGGRASGEGPAVEDLGVQTVGGIAAQGSRTTQTIPAGKIGNNRDLHVVNERWFSVELGMVVKTVNSDPRFGTTTYQLMNVVQ